MMTKRRYGASCVPLARTALVIVTLFPAMSVCSTNIAFQPGFNRAIPKKVVKFNLINN